MYYSENSFPKLMQGFFPGKIKAQWMGVARAEFVTMSIISVTALKKFGY
jgi:hypothetical protein